MTAQRVFIIHRTMVVSGQGKRVDKYNYALAKKYGELVEVFVDDEARQDPANMVDRLADTLSEFSDRDSILCAGDPLLLIMAGAVLENRSPHWNQIRVLKWDKFKRDYVAHYIPRIPQMGG